MDNEEFCQIRNWFISDVKVKSCQSTTLQTLLEHKFLGPVLRHVYSISKDNQLSHVKYAIEVYGKVPPENWPQVRQKILTEIRQKNPNSRENCFQKLEAVRNEKRKLLEELKSKQKEKEAIKKQEFTNNGMKSRVMKRFEAKLSAAKVEITNATNSIRQFKWVAMSLDGFPQFSPLNLSTLSIDVEEFVKYVAQQSMQKLDLTTSASGEFDFEVLLDRYPLSHFVLALKFYMEQQLSAVQSRLLNFEKRQTLWKKQKMTEFRAANGREPSGLQRQTLEVIKIFTALCEDKIDKTTAKSLLNGLKQHNCLPINAINHQDQAKNLGTIIPLMIERLGKAMTDYDQFLHYKIPSFLEEKQLELMSLSGQIIANCMHASNFDYSALYPQPAVLPCKNKENIGVFMDKHLAMIIRKHLQMLLEKIKSETTGTISRQFDHIAGPSLEIILHNLKACLESYQKRQNLDNMSTVLKANNRERHREIVEDINSLIDERHALFSHTFYKLLEDCAKNKKP